MAAFVSAWAGVAAAANNVTTATKTTTSGNTIYVAVCQSVVSATPTITDSKTNTWLNAQLPVNNGNDYISLFYCDNIVGGTLHTITATVSGSNLVSICCGEWSGLLTSGTFDKKATGTGTSVNLDSSNTTTTAQADEVLIGWGTSNVSTSNSFTGTNGSTVRSSVGNGVNFGVLYLEDEMVSATGTYNQTATWGGSSSNWIAGISTFKAAASADDALTTPPIHQYNVHRM